MLVIIAKIHLHYFGIIAKIRHVVHVPTRVITKYPKLPTLECIDAYNECTEQSNDSHFITWSRYVMPSSITESNQHFIFMAETIVLP